VECTTTFARARARSTAKFVTPCDDEEIGIPFEEPGEPRQVPEQEPERESTPEREEEEILTPA
jgi:hypothetical protein